MVTTLSGVIMREGRMAGARVRVLGRCGTQRTTQADATGCYRVDVSGMRPPLLVSAEEGGVPDAAIRAPWIGRLAALCPSVVVGADNRANLNALTDRIVSDVALAMREEDASLLGPQALVERASTEGIMVGRIVEATQAVRALLGDAPGHVGEAAAWFDPLSVEMGPEPGRIDDLLALLIHQRGFDNNTGLPGATLLYDADYRFVGKLDAHSAVEPLDFIAARRAWQEQRDPQRRRIVVLGDSTACNYELAREPRMGWGQALRACFRPDAPLTVINAARAGRSSRAFIEQGYLARVAKLLRPGDYLLIQFGDNDASANRARAVRGAADVEHLATWPDDEQGRPQFDPAQPERAFRHTLQRYLALAEACGATPLLLTPSARLLDAQGRVGLPVVPALHTRHAPGTDYLFVGDYAQTVRNAAAASGTPLIDIEAMSIAFANAHPQDWRDYWLAVDPVRYPWHARQVNGTYDKPDPLHFQARGARLLAGFVCNSLRALQDARLAPLVAMLV